MNKNKPGNQLKTDQKTYDLINSEKLDKLYQKNSQLLSMLSSTGRKNSILQTELFSLIEERSKLGVENNYLTNEVTSLKKTVSHFKDQEKKFYEQSLRLKNQLQNMPITTVQNNMSKPQFFKKQEQAFSEKLVRFLRYRQKVKRIHAQFKEQQFKQKNKIAALEYDIIQLLKNRNQKNKAPVPDLKAQSLSTPQSQVKPQQTSQTFSKETLSQNRQQTETQTKNLTDKTTRTANDNLLKKQLQSFQTENLKLQRDTHYLTEERRKLLETNHDLSNETQKLQDVNLSLSEEKQKLKKTNHNLIEENKRYKKLSAISLKKVRNCKKQAAAFLKKGKNFKKQTSKIFRRQIAALWRKSGNFKRQSEISPRKTKSLRKKLAILKRKARY